MLMANAPLHVPKLALNRSRREIKSYPKILEAVLTFTQQPHQPLPNSFGSWLLRIGSLVSVHKE
jgi:hypothetical protein